MISGVAVLDLEHRAWGVCVHVFSTTISSHRVESVQHMTIEPMKQSLKPTDYGSLLPHTLPQTHTYMTQSLIH